MCHISRLSSVLWLSIALLALTGCTAPGATPAAPQPSPSSVVVELPTAAVTPVPPDPPATPFTATPAPGMLPTAPLTYLWPEHVPEGLEINGEQSWAAEDGFKLMLEDPTNAQRTLELYGGWGSPAAARPPAMGSEPAVVRGQPGVAFSTGGGRSLHWDENGHPYRLGGFFGNEDLLQVTQQLASADLQGWRERLAASTGESGSSGGAARMGTYFWPGYLPPNFEIRSAESTLDDTSFRIEVLDTGSGQFSFSIVGGTTSVAAQPPNSHNRAEVTVRGQPGQTYTTGAGYSVFWKEHGQPYAIIGGLGLDMALDIAEALEPLGQAALRERLAAQ